MSEHLQFPDLDAFYETFEANGWGDGLPLQPPTPAGVEAFIAASGKLGDTVLGSVPPSRQPATVEKVAVNAIMAGCRAEYMPVLVTALEATLEPRLNCYSLQTTTHPAALMTLVSGPVAADLQINGGTGAFGPGFRANATIGRAMRLVLLNLGGGRPGVGDLATQGSPAKYTYCFAENEEDCPWEPYRVTVGFGLADSVVTVAPLEGPYNINDHASYTGSQLLTTIVGAISHAGTNLLYCGGSDPFLFLGPEHAGLLAKDKLERRDIQEFVFKNARVDRDRLGSGQFDYLRQRHKVNERYEELGLGDPGLRSIPLFSKPDDLNIVVVGGPGKHSAFASTMSRTRSVTKAIERRAGRGSAGSVSTGGTT